MQRAEWLVERPWRLVVLVLLVAAPLLALAEFAAADTQRRVAEEQRREVRSVAERAAEATASRAEALLDKLAGAATTTRLRGAIGLAARPVAGGPRETIEPPDLRELSFQLDSFHAVMRDEVATLFVLDGAGFVLEMDPPGGTADGRVAAGKDLGGSQYAQALITTAHSRFVGVDPGTESFVFAVPLAQQATYNQRSSRAQPGALVAELRPTFLGSSLQSLIGSVNDLYVVDGEGRLLARLNGESRPFQSLRQHPAVAAAIAGRTFLDNASDPITGVPGLVATARIGDLGWSVIAVAREDALRAEVDVGLAQQRGLRLGLIAVLLIGALLVGGTSSAAIRRRRETAEALAQQTATSDVLKTISQSAFDLRAVFDVVVENALSLCRGDFSYLFRREGDVFQIVASRGGTPELVAYEYAHPTPLSRDTLIGRVALERQAVHIPDLFQDPAYDWPSNRAAGVHTVLGVPIFKDDEVVGAIGVARNEMRPFSDAEIRLVKTFADQAAIAMDNVRLFNETKDALAQQVAVAEVLQTISTSAFDLTPVFDVILRQSIDLCSADSGWIALRVEDKQVKMVAAVGRIDDRFRVGDVGEPKQMAARVIAVQRTVHDPAFSATDYWGRTRLGVPLLHNGQAIGVIVLGRDAYERPFTDRQIQLVETFAKQAVIAIENVRLFNETKEALEQQTAVGDVLKTISRSAFDLQPVLDIVLNNAVRLAGADIGWLSRVENEQFTTVAYSTDFPESVREELVRQRAQGHIAGPWIPLGTGGGLMGFTLAEGHTVHLPDVKEDPELKGSTVARLTASRTVVGVPMLRDGRSIGGMVLARYEVRPFSERELELVQTFADQAAIAIENVRLFNETKEALERQTAISEVLRVISRSTFDIRPVMETVITHAARLCDADLAWMRRVDREGRPQEPASYGRTPELTEVLRKSMARSERAFREGGYEFAKGLMGRVIRERRKISLDDIRTDPELFQHSFTAREAGARTVLAVPLLLDNDAVGMLIVARTSVRPFGERELQLVETFAQQAAIAMQNVSLFNEIQDKSRQLEIASRHKSEFLANMSHELRTPLNAIIGFSEVLLQGLFGDVNEKQREYLADVLGSGQHLLSLINDILDLSKIEAGRMDLEVSTFSFRDALDGGLTIVRERAARHAIQLNAVVASDVGTLEADERKVKQILYNLLSNAVKFTPDGGRVDVSVGADNGDIRVEVRDTGIGVALEDQEQIFEEFRQVGRERSREGTGLGLTLTKRFVELHGGRIWLDSTPGKGSTFTFTLPLRRAAAVRA